MFEAKVGVWSGNESADVVVDLAWRFDCVVALADMPDAGCLRGLRRAVARGVLARVLAGVRGGGGGLRCVWVRALVLRPNRAAGEVNANPYGQLCRRKFLLRRRAFGG